MRTLAACLLLFLVITSCKQEDERYLVVSKVKSAAKLATTETTIDKVVLGTQERKLLGFIKVNKAHFAAYTQATITAGVDLSKLDPGDIVIQDKRIEIDLPHVEVLDFSYPFSKYRIDSTITRNAFLNKIDILDHEKFYMMAELDIRNNLRYTGIEKATEDKTRIMMEGMLKNLGYEEVYVTFKPGQLIEEIKLDNDIEQ
ncbi:MAG: DUF4230 domain-containing protein [Cyclobacteriaceae bacterium]|nr:DUF4230 domain-containing protein [Cyclobacteriaceae bacterium HetDA_MAG_MS6]